MGVLLVSLPGCCPEKELECSVVSITDVHRSTLRQIHPQMIKGPFKLKKTLEGAPYLGNMVNFVRQGKPLIIPLAPLHLKPLVVLNLKN